MRAFLKNLIKHLPIVWRIIGVLATVTALGVGLLNLHDRLTIKPVPLTAFKEYIFGNENYYVQALVENSKVVEFAVTTRKADFNPVIELDKYAFHTDSRYPSNSSKMVSDETNVILGKTTFSELNYDPVYIWASLGFHDYQYQEEYYFGNPGLYESYFLANNESGSNQISLDEGVLAYLEKKLHSTSTLLSAFRSSNVINTYGVSAPGMGFDSRLRKYMIGPFYHQVRVIPDAFLVEDEDKKAQLENLRKLSPEVNIQVFIDTLGKPLVVNDSPEYQMPELPTLDKLLW